jgi:putative methionine-R-sulfoxide reductase with GAF domain
MNFIRLGINDSQPKWLQQRIRATNVVFATIAVILIFLLINAIIFAAQIMIYAVSVSLITVALMLWIHSSGHHHISRFSVSVLPVFISSCIQGAYQMNTDLPNASAWVFIIGFQVLPFLLFDPSEKNLRLVTITLNIIIASCYEQFNRWIDLEQAPHTPPLQVFVTIEIGLILTIGLLSAMDDIFVRTNKENRELIKSVEREKEEQKIAQEKLNKTLEELNKSKAEEEKRTWAAKGVAEAVKILHEDDNLSAIADKLLVFLVKVLHANQAGLFLLEEKNQEQSLEMKACYAYQRKKYLKKTIAIGEGLVGQCYLEKACIYLTDVPEDYILIGSGLGDSKPRSILIIPLMANEKVYGILELASFKAFQDYEINFLMEVGENIAMTVRSMKANEQTQALLYETKSMAELMKSQEEVMRQSMEEIAATQEELSRREEELKLELKTKDEEIVLLKEKLAKYAASLKSGVLNQSVSENTN